MSRAQKKSNRGDDGGISPRAIECSGRGGDLRFIAAEYMGKVVIVFGNRCHASAKFLIVIFGSPFLCGLAGIPGRACSSRVRRGISLPTKR